MNQVYLFVMALVERLKRSMFDDYSALMVVI